MIKKALIIGANGPVGKTLTDYLLKKEYFVFHINKSKKKLKTKKNLKILNFDLKNKKLILNFLKKHFKIEIYYLASRNLSSYEKENFEFFIDNLDANVLSLVNCLEAIKLSNQKHRLIYTASSRLFECLKNKKIDENTNFNYNSYYSLSKDLGLKIIKFYKIKFHLHLSSVILFSNYSKYSSKIFLIPKIINQVKRNKKINIQNKNFNLDFVDTYSVCKFLNKIIKLKNPDNYIISSGKKFSFNEIVNEIFSSLKINKKLSGKKENISKNNYGYSNKLLKKMKLNKNFFNLRSIIKNIIDYE